jgi:hypothetical protein
MRSGGAVHAAHQAGLRWDPRGYAGEGETGCPVGEVGRGGSAQELAPSGVNAYPPGFRCGRHHETPIRNRSRT